MVLKARIATNNPKKPVSIDVVPGDERLIDMRIGDVHPAEHVWLTRGQAATLARLLDAASRVPDSDPKNG